MPIVGLTDRNAGFPQIGVLRKGAPKPERGPGRDLEHFRFDGDDEDASLAFRSIYGDEPRAVRVFVPYATTDENFEAWREDWVASSLKHRCDGQICVRWLTGNGSYSTEPIPCPGGCKQVGRLKVIIPELRRMAFVTVLTTSIHDIMEIHANLAALESARGDLRGIPLIVRRVPREISTPSGDGKRVRRVKWLINIEAQPDWVELQLAAAAEAARPTIGAPRPALELPAWEEWDEDEADDDALTMDDIAEIYHTETGGQARIRPMEEILDWAEGRKDLFDVRNNKFYRRLPEKSATHSQAVAVPGRAALPEAKQSPLINETNEAALTLEKQLKQACMTICNQDRTRAADLFARQYAGLSFGQRQEALLALNAPASEQQIARIDDQLMRALDLGQTRQQVDEQVSRLTNGAAFSTLTTVQIMSVIHALEIWIDGVYQEKRQAEQSPDAEGVRVASSDPGDSASAAKKAGRR